MRFSLSPRCAIARRRLLAAGVCGLALSQAAQAQSLTDALTGAYLNNPQLLAERAQLRVVDETVPKAKSGWRPTVQVTGSYGRSRAGIEKSTGGFTGNVYASPYSYGLNLAQPLYEGGRTAAETRNALDQVNAERAHLQSTEQTVLLGAITDYLDVVANQATLDLTINNQHVFEKQLEATRDRFNVGEVTRTDVAQAEAALADAVAQREQADGNLQIARENYARDIGMMPGVLQAPQVKISLPGSKDAATQLAAAANPDVVTAHFNESAAQNNVRAVKSQLLPSLSLNAGVARQNQSEVQQLRYSDETLTAQLTVPLYEAGSVYSDTRAAWQTVTVRQRQFDQARLQAVQSAGAAWEQLRVTAANVASYQSQIKANVLALEGVRQESMVGERTVLDVLNAEQAVFQSRVNLVRAQHDDAVAQYTLASSVGHLTARDLALPVAYYDPTVHFDAVKNKWIGFGDHP